jgi:hypothetical protein
LRLCVLDNRISIYSRRNVGLGCCRYRERSDSWKVQQIKKRGVGCWRKEGWMEETRAYSQPDRRPEGHRSRPQRLHKKTHTKRKKSLALDVPKRVSTLRNVWGGGNWLDSQKGSLFSVITTTSSFDFPWGGAGRRKGKDGQHFPMIVTIHGDRESQHCCDNKLNPAALLAMTITNL